MGRRLGAQTKITWRPGQRRAEMVQPDPIDQHAGRKRIIRARDGLAEFEASAPVLKWLALFSGQHLQKLPRDLFARVASIAAQKNVRLNGRGIVFQRHGARWSTWMGGVEFVDFP